LIARERSQQDIKDVSDGEAEKTGNDLETKQNLEQNEEQNKYFEEVLGG
jgi:hypothetical protein